MQVTTQQVLNSKKRFADGEMTLMFTLCLQPPPPRVANGISNVSTLVKSTWPIPIIAAFALVGLPACEPESSQALTPIDEDAAIAETSPLKTGPVDLTVQVEDGLLSFKSGEDYFEAIALLNDYETSAVLDWTRESGVNTILSTVESLDAGLLEFENLSEQAQKAIEFHPVTDDPLLSDNVLRLSHTVRSPEGFVIVDGLVGYADRYVQVWAPRNRERELRRAVLADDYSSSDEFIVVSDSRSERAATLASRGDDLVRAPRFPWPAGGGSTDRNTNVAGSRRVVSQWDHEQEVARTGSRWIVGQAVSLDGYSYKRTFGYKTDHTYNFLYTWRQNDGRNIDVSEGRLVVNRRAKRFVDTDLYHTEVVSFSDLASASTTIVDLGAGVTEAGRSYHRHRGTNGESNILVE